MVRLVVDEDGSVDIGLGNYRFSFHVQEDGRVLFERWTGEGHHTMLLDPAEDGKRQTHPNDIPLDRNLTEPRLPQGVRDAEILRLIVWEENHGARSILDIAEAPRRQMIRWWNRERDRYAMQGAVEARLEIVPNGGR